MKVDGEVIVVTGAGSGMGRELTILLIQKGARVAMVDIDEKGLKETAELAGNAQVSLHALNIADRSGVIKLPAQVNEIQNHLNEFNFRGLKILKSAKNSKKVHFLLSTSKRKKIIQ